MAAAAQAIMPMGLEAGEDLEIQEVLERHRQAAMEGLDLFLQLADRL
jgi:hypothetical protein